MQDQQQNISRRTLLKRLTGLAIAGFAFPHLLAACADKNSDNSEAVASCQEDIGLWDSTTHKAVNYVAQSSHVDKNCANCQFFNAVQDGSACGTCEIVSGPIAPKAYCDAWVMQKEST